MIMIDIAERSIAVFDHFIKILLQDEMQSSNDLLNCFVQFDKTTQEWSLSEPLPTKCGYAWLANEVTGTRVSHPGPHGPLVFHSW